MGSQVHHCFGFSFDCVILARSGRTIRSATGLTALLVTKPTKAYMCAELFFSHGQLMPSVVVLDLTPPRPPVLVPNIDPPKIDDEDEDNDADNPYGAAMQGIAPKRSRAGAGNSRNKRANTNTNTGTGRGGSGAREAGGGGLFGAGGGAACGGSGAGGGGGGGGGGMPLCPGHNQECILRTVNKQVCRVQITDPSAKCFHGWRVAVFVLISSAQVL